MGYEIQYQPELSHKYSVLNLHRGRKVWWIYGGIAVGVLILSVATPLRQWIWDFLIPGDPQVTTKAVGTFMKDLHDGHNFTDAITTFCQEILSNG